MTTVASDQCFHCGLPLVSGSVFTAQVLGENRDMCCPGCQAVAQAIVANGLEDYYRFRTEKAQKAEAEVEQILEHLRAYDHPDIQQEFIIEDGQYKQIQLTIEGISCAACGWLIEKQLVKLEGIKRVSVNVSSRRASVTWQASTLKLSQIIQQLERIGYHALPFQPDQHEASFKQENRLFLKRLGLAGLMSMQVMMLAIGLYFGIFGNIDPQTKRYFHWISLILSTPVVIYSGWGFYKSAWNAIKARIVNMDVSVSLAILGTYLSSAWATVTANGEIYFESVCMFIFLLLISRFLEHRARYQASLISANMLKYIPVTATKLENGQLVQALAKHLKAGDRILVKAGQTIPVDGIVQAGNGQVDESMLTGESCAVDKKAGDLVYGGTVNFNSSLTIEVSKSLKYALVNQIIRMQEDALSAKPKISVYADRASRHFVAVVLVIAALSYGVWLSVDADRAFWIAIAVLVATCPCALSLATPSALTSAIAKLNRSGLLIKRADVLEAIPEIDTVVFDKTGTLTHGHFVIAQCDLLSTQDETEVLKLVASLEAYSEHPISKAFAHIESLYPVDNCQIVSGKGITAEKGAAHITLGSADFVSASGAQQRLYPKANVWLKINDQLVAAITVSDQLKPDAKQLISSLSDKRLLILSGDSQRNVETVAKQLGIEQFYWQQSPQQKLQVMQSLQADNRRVLMIGDGINDAPVMAKANVSVAVVGAGDIAKRSADILLLKQNLSSLLRLFSMSARVRSKIKQNMLWAIGYNVLILPLAVFGFLTPWMAVIGMSLSSIIVVVNSVRLLK